MVELSEFRGADDDVEVVDELKFVDVDVAVLEECRVIGVGDNVKVLEVLRVENVVGANVVERILLKFFDIVRDKVVDSAEGIPAEVEVILDASVRPVELKQNTLNSLLRGAFHSMSPD